MQQSQDQELVDRTDPKMGNGPQSWYLTTQNDSIRLGVVVGQPHSISFILDGLADEIVLVVRLRGSVIELPNRVKGRPLLDSGVIGNFLSDPMVTPLNLKIQASVGF